jgi:hypothetical protein
LNWTTYLNGVVSQSGIVDLLADGRVLPTTIAAGEIASQGSGTYTITVELLLDGITTTVDATYESFASGVSVIPLVLILVLAATTHMVEVSLFTGIFVGACIVAGSLKQGFFTTLSTYLLDAVSDESHGYVYLFTFFLSGLVGMMMKSGGFVGFTTFMSYWATNPIAGQMVAYISGCVIFFVSREDLIVICYLDPFRLNLLLVNISSGRLCQHVSNRLTKLRGCRFLRKFLTKLFLHSLTNFTASSLANP